VLPHPTCYPFLIPATYTTNYDFVELLALKFIHSVLLLITVSNERFTTQFLLSICTPKPKPIMSLLITRFSLSLYSLHALA